MLELRNIFKTYENKPLLRDISFTVKQGETVCMLGPSGSGKSTLLRIIAGLETSEKGDIFWNGENIAGIPVHKRNFGLMFQDYALFPHKTVYENVAFGLKMQKFPPERISERVSSVLSKVHMTGFENRRVTELSGGEQQRVALARTLAPNPRLLMFDEPLGALDRALREQLIIELREILAETKVLAIYVTHDQLEAFAIAQRIIFLHDGIIMQSGTPDEVRAHPANQWVKDFLGLQNLAQNEETSHPENITVIKRSASGEETWRYSGKIMRREEDHVVLEAFFNRDDMPFMGTTLKRGDRFVETFYITHWYNIFEIYDRDDGTLKGHYCNIGTPAIFENKEVLSYKDLALDLWIAPDDTQTVLDEDEFNLLDLDTQTRQTALTALEELKLKFTK